MSNHATKPRRRLSRKKRLLFALIPLCALILGGELIMRLVRGPLHFGSFRELRTDLLKRNYPAALDDRLGYVPKAGFASRDNHWQTQVSIDADGIRKNGTAPPPAGELIVAVGDSFTFGDQVDDGQSWPAQLERILDQPVKNGGVFGYSLAQSVLRAEDLIRRFRPHMLIVSFIPDDLRRCTYSRRYTPIPWFDLVDGELVLRGVPIDHGDRPPVSTFKHVLGHSALADAICASASRAWWYEDEKQTPIDHLWNHKKELGCGLVDRVARICREQDVTPLLLLQSNSTTPDALAVMRHAEDIGMATLDLASEFERRQRDEPALQTRWFDGHMTPEGNHWVAQRLATSIRALKR